jgi:hypothetical protein
MSDVGEQVATRQQREAKETGGCGVVARQNRSQQLPQAASAWAARPTVDGSWWVAGPAIHPRMLRRRR